MGTGLPLAARPRWLTAVIATIVMSTSPHASAALRASHDATRAGEDPAPATEGATRSRAWAHVAVDTSAVGEAGPAIRRRVQERADVVLRRAGVMPGRGAGDPTITVIIREVGKPDPGWEYAITVAAEGQTPPPSETIGCPLCTETELIDKIEGQLTALAARIEAPQDPPPPRVDPTPTREGDDPVTPVDDPQPQGRGLGKMGKAGVALLVTGAAGAIAGAVLAALPPRPQDGDPTHEVFTQPPGYALLGAGGGLLITGAILLAVDRARHRKQSSTRGKTAGKPRARP